jgi:hypothetical protein
LLVVLAIAGFVFLGVFPKSDFSHLTSVYPPVIVAGALVLRRLAERLPEPRPGWLRVGAGLGWLILGLYAAVAGQWYHNLLTTMDREIAQERGGVLVSPLLATALDVEVEAIRSRTDPGEAVLTVPDLAMLNFLADRPMPSRYYEMYAHMIAHDQGAGVVREAEAKGVRLAVTRFNNFFSDRVGLREYAPELANYLRTQFAPVMTVGGDHVMILSRRETPLSGREPIEILESCDFPADDSDDRFSREHLLFLALYHDPGTQGPSLPVETRCEVAVPEDGELVVRIGYWTPERASPGASLLAEVRAVTGSGGERLLSETMELVAERGWSSPPYPEYRLDLSHLANQEVTFVFRTARRGSVRMSPMDLAGFAMVWQDPRIEVGGVHP